MLNSYFLYKDWLFKTKEKNVTPNANLKKYSDTKAWFCKFVFYSLVHFQPRSKLKLIILNYFYWILVLTNYYRKKGPSLFAMYSIECTIHTVQGLKYTVTGEERGLKRLLTLTFTTYKYYEVYSEKYFFLFLAHLFIL